MYIITHNTITATCMTAYAHTIVLHTPQPCPQTTSTPTPLLHTHTHTHRLPQHSDQLVDYLGVPYPDSYQAAFRAQRVLCLPPADRLEFGASLPPALSQAPPTVSAAAWRVAEEGGTVQAVSAAMQRAVQRAAEWEMGVTARAARHVAGSDGMQTLLSAAALQPLDEVCLTV